MPEFAGSALKLSKDDLAAAATSLGCELAVIEAVTDVESRGAGFLPDKRPTILFEAHVFSRLTNHRFDDSHPGISSRHWNKALYKGGAAEYDRLGEAIALDRKAALQSASWGMFQIMGFNYGMANFSDVEAFVTAHTQSEAQHLAAFLAFVRASHLDQALRDKHWAQFANGYNGPEYATNHYDTKLETAYDKHK